MQLKAAAVVYNVRVSECVSIVSSYHAMTAVSQMGVLNVVGLCCVS
jgi:hypothetical protein